MNYTKIKRLQKEYNFKEVQDSIDSGLCWKMEGSVGRNASVLLDSGACMLPTEAKFDYYGNRVPSRNDLKKGTKGTYQNSVKFWEGVEDGTIEIDEWEECED